MPKRISPASVRQIISVEVPQEKAFRVFTESFGEWWPATHSIGASPLRNAVIEPHKGGRWFEIGEDGSETVWGDVLAWEPPARLLLAWRIGADWTCDPNLLTEVEVKFIPLGESQTRVELEHRLLENMGPAAEGARAAFESERGWSGMLRLFAAKVVAQLSE